MLKKLLGQRTPERKANQQTPPATGRRDPQDPSKVRVLFLCIGNSCRSPMAEGLARKYGSDVLVAHSAGLSPIHRVDPLGIAAMRERNIDISSAYPKGVGILPKETFDLVVNMSGQTLSSLQIPVEEWTIPDPIGQDQDAFRKTADLLEQYVMRLILQLRLKQHPIYATVQTR